MAQQLPSSGYIIGLDIGAARIGVAVSSVIAKLPQPLDPVMAGDDSYQSIAKIIDTQQAKLLVVGIPRNLNGEETKQSHSIREYVQQLNKVITIPVVFVDESLSSVRADEVLKDNTFKNVSSDSLAACFILEEYFQTSANGELR